MNMLTNLKTLLFSSAAMKMPVAGDGASVAPATGELDFAALLTGSMTARSMPVADVPVPAMDAAAVEAEGDPATSMADPGKGEAVPLALPPVVVAGEGETPALPISPAKEEREPEAQGEPKVRSENLPERPAPTQAAPAAIVTPDEDEAPVSDHKAEKAEKVDEDASPDASSLLTPPFFVPPVTVAAPPSASKVAAAPKAQAVIEAAPVASMAGQAVQPLATEEKASISPAAPTVPMTLPVVENADKDAAAMPQDRANMPVLPPAGPSKDNGKEPGRPSTFSLKDGAAPVPPSHDALPPAAPAAKISRSEALSLLQMVREQFSRMPVEGVRTTEAAVMPSPRSARDGKPVALDLAAPATSLNQPDSAGSAPAPLPPLTVTGAPVLPVAAPPSVNLGASLGAQVVDMGVSGQWIDGLARDIAGLAQNGAQGRFQINASQLGPVQVDIRHGADGAAVSLTVAHEAAELALKQDSDRLRLDAGLAAVRISDVRIERAPHVAEAARPDGGGQSGAQQQGQQSSSQGSASGWQNGGQGMGQPERQGHGQGQGQARENSASGLKGSADRAVINQKDAGDGAGDIRRARYA
ncbi:Flagellar hook-length control protein FliK [Sphingobium faniae]|nr:Flagellar hook-length control protein FliK [Sphingobium faniae]